MHASRSKHSAKSHIDDETQLHRARYACGELEASLRYIISSYLAPLYSCLAKREIVSIRLYNAGGRHKLMSSCGSLYCSKFHNCMYTCVQHLQASQHAQMHIACATIAQKCSLIGSQTPTRMCMHTIIHIILIRYRGCDRCGRCGTILPM